ncbi:MAG: HupE/UreJ family protein [Rhodospirillales bacterium]|nr:HupE/UreJ family protein [Rhodospirillales bacterium]
MLRRFLVTLITVLVLIPAAAQAHKPSDSYLTLAEDQGALTGQWDIALRDLYYALGLDANDDGAITRGELKARRDAVAAYALARLKISAENKVCALRPTEQLVARHSDGAYAVLRFAAACPAAVERLEVSYRLFFDLDPQHRGLLQLVQGEANESAIFSPEAPVQSFTLGTPRPWRQLRTYLWEGVWHIWIGFDHILFLLTLLLPAVLLRRDGAWRPVGGPRDAFGQVFKIVTAFTLAHSITLSLAALDVVALPSRLVESVIAASVVVAAINNLVPVVTRRLWIVAFAFGLIHGFGFAGVLADLDLPGGALLVSLLGFNLGVELGQLAIVAVFLPLAFLLRGTGFYPRVALPAGSLAVAGVATLWLIERAFNVAPLVAL